MPPWTRRRWLAVSCLALLVVLGALDTSLMSPLAAEEQSASLNFSEFVVG